MGFIEDAQDWLRARDEAPVVAPELPKGVSIDGRREVMWEALASIQRRSARADAHARWSRPGYLEAFVAEVGAAICSGLGARWKRPQLVTAIDGVLRAAIGEYELRNPDPHSDVIALELARISDATLERLAPSFRVDVPGDALSEWARANRLVDAEGRTTAVGRAFMGLVGREAVYFALELETFLSTGVADEHRVSRRTLAELAEGTLDYSDHLDPDDCPRHNYLALKRLGRMGVADHVREQEGTDEFSISSDGHELVRAVLDPAPNPYRALARALLDAERGHLTTTLTGAAAPPETDLAYVRMVVHELRNVTLPLSNALDRLWTEIERPEPPDPARMLELRQRVERSLARMTEFTRDSARLAAVVTPESFPLVDIVEEAIAATEADRNGRIRVQSRDLTTIRIDGQRARWLLLFVNLLRNAAQSRAGSGNVLITADWTLGGPVQILVDDDGPGIPEELREQIFELGVSTRGGSGMGLHDARTTVLLSGGTLRCEASPMGGARFRIQVPARRRV